jgi:hypothetical protein
MVGSPAGQQLARLVAVSRAAQHQPGSDGVPTGTRVQAHGFEAVVQLVKVLALDRDAEVELFLVLSTPVCTVGSDRNCRDIRMAVRASQTLPAGRRVPLDARRWHTK